MLPGPSLPTWMPCVLFLRWGLWTHRQEQGRLLSPRVQAPLGKQSVELSPSHPNGGLLLKVNYLMNFWLRWVFVAAHGLSLVAASGGSSSLRAHASHYGAFFRFGARALDVLGSVVVARGLSSCGPRA